MVNMVSCTTIQYPDIMRIREEIPIKLETTGCSVSREELLWSFELKKAMSCWHWFIERLLVLDIASSKFYEPAIVWLATGVYYLD